jgi:stage V sporulation protein S
MAGINNPSGSQATIIKVASTSRSTAVAGAIAGMMREHRFAEVQAIGAGAVNQAVKALAIAQSYLVQDGIDIVCVPYFMDIEIMGNERTVIRFKVMPRTDGAADVQTQPTSKSEAAE